MAEWGTYELIDFLMFSPSAYLRMIELFNADLWPAQILLLLLYLLLGQRMGAQASAFAYATLGVIWIFVGYVFFLHRYAEILWAAPYVGWGFVLQGLLMLAVGGLRAAGLRSAGYQEEDTASLDAIFLVVPGLYLIFHWAVGRSPEALELAGLLPDPTVVLSLFVFLWSRAPWWLFPIPIVWTLVSTLTQFALELDGYWVLTMFVFGGVALKSGLRVGVSRTSRRENVA